MRVEGGWPHLARRAELLCECDAGGVVSDVAPREAAKVDPRKLRLGDADVGGRVLEIDLEGYSKEGEGVRAGRRGGLGEVAGFGPGGTGR